MTEKQRSQRPAIAQPEGLQIFQAAAAALLVGRSMRIFSLLAPCSSLKSLATHSFLFMRWVLVKTRALKGVRFRRRPNLAKAGSDSSGRLQILSSSLH